MSAPARAGPTATRTGPTATLARRLWTLPNTILGLALGALTFQVPRLEPPGVVVFDRSARGFSWILALVFRKTAVTYGHCVISARPLEGRVLQHELHHVRQYERWGPLYIPAYLVLFAVRGYRRHPFELSADAAAGAAPAAGRARRAALP